MDWVATSARPIISSRASKSAWLFVMLSALRQRRIALANAGLSCNARAIMSTEMTIAATSQTMVAS